MYVVNELAQNGVSKGSKFYGSIEALLVGVREAFEEREGIVNVQVYHDQHAFILAFTKKKITEEDLSQYDLDEILKVGHVQRFPNLQWAERSLKALGMRTGSDKVYQAVIFAPENESNFFGENQNRQDHTFHNEEQVQ